MMRGMITATLVGIVASGTIAWAGADEGKALYEKQCKVCHSVGGDKGKMADKGGPLDGEGKKRDAEWLKKYIADPKSVMPDAKMPKMKLTPEQVDDLVAYMQSLK
jgi:mono/diheme cytochrome c family protein